jgi:hypothetical protein
MLRLRRHAHRLAGARQHNLAIETHHMLEYAKTSIPIVLKRLALSLCESPFGWRLSQSQRLQAPRLAYVRPRDALATQ